MITNSPKLLILQWFLLYLSFSCAQKPVQLNTRDGTASTCPFRTINYITHSLPQQCLATTNSALTSQRAERDHVHVGDSSSARSDEQQPQSTETRADLVDTPATSATTDPDQSLRSPAVINKEPGSGLAEDKSAVSMDNPEEESELESEKFLSFEEWKKQNLKKTGQSEHIAHRNQESSREARKRSTNVHNALESLGDEGEIDIDFSGFVPGGPQSVREVSQPVTEHSPDVGGMDSSKGRRARIKDAGTTSKERFNYASFDCAANILKTNKEAKSSHTVLMENKDSYMLNQCAAPNKFLILELCNDIEIDTVVLANFEFFSSTFRTFRVSVSDRYPVETEKWKSLGTYEARNTREIQAFLVENPVTWARYVRIEFLTHYGSEFYCPVSLVRIHGKTMFEDWKDSHDNEDSDRDSNYDAESVDAFIPEAATEDLETKTPDPEDRVVEHLVQTSTHEVVSTLSMNYTEPQDASSTVPASVVAFEAIMSVIESSDTCIAADSPSATSPRTAPSPALPPRILDVSTTVAASSLEPSPNSSGTRSVTSPQVVSISGHSTSVSKNLTDASSGRSATQPVSSSSSGRPSIASSSTDSTSTRLPNSYTEKSTAPDGSKSSSVTTQQQRDKPSTTSSQDRAKSGGSPSQAQPATPTMQESFFKSVQKRLQMLEANSSLSLQYIEDQSRALRDAFKKVEQRQLTKTTAFLDQLNQTVLSELRDFRQQYDQLWQSTVIELNLQRERYERDNEAINARLGILADEVIFQRRMAVLQMVLILVCLVLVLFSRGVINNYLELPLVQNVLSKSPSSKWLNLSNTESPARPPQPARMRSAHQLRNGILKSHRRMQSEDSFTDTQSGPEIYAPPTPISDYGHSEMELSRDESKSPTFDSDKDDNKFDDPEFDPNSIERPSTSPPILRINGASLISDILETSEEDLGETMPATKSKSIPNNATPLTLTTDFVPIGKRLSWDLPNS